MWEDSAKEPPMGIALGRPASFLEGVGNDLRRAEEEVKRLTELKALLVNNPETQRILELLGRKY